MVKTVLGVNHQGLSEWKFQRLTAIVMAVYVIGLIAFFCCHANLSFAEWHTLFSHVWMKVMTLLVLVSILYHAWIGMWTIFTDYVKPFVVRAIICTIMFLMFVACFAWGLLILWSV